MGYIETKRCVNDRHDVPALFAGARTCMHCEEERDTRIRGEAEQIVQVVRETSSLASCSDVVAALAAAIEVEDSVRALIIESDRVENGFGDTDQDWTRPFIDMPVRKHHGSLRTALSALRSRGREENGDG